MSVNQNIVGSVVSISERWFKLYRKIHNLFISRELVHVKDSEIMFTQLNARIDQLNQKLDQNLNGISTDFAAHMHNSPQAPGGMLITAAPVKPMVVDMSPIPVIKYTTANMKIEDNVWKGLGPAMAPLGNGTSLAAMQATLTAASQTVGEG